MATSTVRQIRAEIKKKREELKKAVQDAFTGGIKTYFDEFPDLKAVSWTQYTPHFNDGEPCTFGSQHEWPDFAFGALPEDLDDADAWEESEGKNPAAEKKLLEFLKAFEDDDMLQMFGDHARVIVTRRGVKVREYDHD